MTRLTKKEVGVFVKRIHRFMDAHPDKVCVKKINWYTRRGGKKFIPIAFFFPNNKSIVVDYRKSFLDGLVHESLHRMHPEWTEREVIRMENLLLNSMSESQAKSLIKHFAAIL